MQFVLFIAVAVTGVVFTQAMTTMRTTHAHGHHHSHGPKPSREPSEKENFQFYYNPSTHHMYVHVGQECYIATLSTDEMTAVHSDTGIRALELKLLSMLSTATTITKDTLSTMEQKLCGKRATMFYTVP